MFLEGMHEKGLFNENHMIRVIINTIDDFDYPAHWHNAIEIVYCMENGIDVRIGSRDIQLNEKDILFICPGEIHGFKAQEIKGKRVFIQFDITSLDGLDAVKNTFNPFVNTFKLSCARHYMLYRKISNQLISIIDAHNKKEPSYSLYLKARIYDVFFLLSTNTDVDIMTDNRKGGLILWLDLLFVIAFFMFSRWYKKGEGRELGVTMYDMGLSFDREKTVIDWKIIGKTVIMAAIMFGLLYVLTTIGYRFFNTDLRFIWPFLRPFTAGRLLQFLLYLPFFLLFFLFNGGVRLFGQMRLKEYESPAKTQIVWWLKNIYVMLGGLVIVSLFEYVPFLLGFGTGWALTGLSIFDGPFMSALVLIFPQFFVLFFVATYFYRKTGKVYLGSLITAIVVSWITCGGAAYF
jgi:hypothetical protein